MFIVQVYILTDKIMRNFLNIWSIFDIYLSGFKLKIK